MEDRKIVFPSPDQQRFVVQGEVRFDLGGRRHAGFWGKLLYSYSMMNDKHHIFKDLQYQEAGFL
jgi:hypothetical protein